MQSRDFVFWLQGFFEITNQTSLTTEQVQIIKNHLGLVFQHDNSLRQTPGMVQEAPIGKYVDVKGLFRKSYQNPLCGQDGIMIC